MRRVFPISRDKNAASRAWYVVQAALEYFIAILVGGAYLARVTAALGFSDSLTGVLSSFVSLGCVFQLAAIALFRRGGRVKKAVLGASLLNQLLFGMVYVAPVIRLSSSGKAAVFLACFCGAYIIYNMIFSQKTDWLMSLVEDGKRGSFTAVKEIVSLLSGMAFTFAMGTAIDRLEAAGRQRDAFILGAVTIFALAALHTVTLAAIREVPAANREKAPGGMFAFLKEKMILRVTLVTVLWHVASGCAVPFYGAYEIHELGFSMTFISILSILYSVVRALVSPALGRYADKHSFGRMVYLCFMVAAAGFLVNCFTVPSNGRVFYAIYYCLYAIAMGGINSSLMNLVFDYIQGPNRLGALAATSALGGVSGFAATCAMSPVVALIQRQGNSLWGISLYPAQFASAVALLLTLALIAYVRVFVIGAKK